MPLSVAHIEILLIFINVERGEPRILEPDFAGRGGFFPGVPLRRSAGARKRRARANMRNRRHPA
jgi:hypothetical protein